LLFAAFVASRKSDKVIAHFRDGRLLRGTTKNFRANRHSFRMNGADGTCHEINLRDLKALFFVKELEGNSDYHERKGFFDDPKLDSKVLVEFLDGEVIFGYAKNSAAGGLGFFLVPGDPHSNNIKVFVVQASTRRVMLKQSADDGEKAPQRTPSKATVD
jgi:Family of unknown function (DUF6982)